MKSFARAESMFFGALALVYVMSPGGEWIRSFFGGLSSMLPQQAIVLPETSYEQSESVNMPRVQTASTQADDTWQCAISPESCWFPEGTGILSGEWQNEDNFALTVLKHYRLQNLPFAQILGDKDQVKITIRMQGDDHDNHILEDAKALTGYSTNSTTGFDVVATYVVTRQYDGNIQVVVDGDNQQHYGAETNLLLVLLDENENVIEEQVVPYQPGDYNGRLEVGEQVVNFTLLQGENKPLGTFLVPITASTSIEYSNMWEQNTLAYIQQKLDEGWIIIDTKTRQQVQFNPIISSN